MRAWLGVALIVLAVLVVRGMPTPWRGIVDAAVAAALSSGLCAILAQVRAATRRSQPPLRGAAFAGTAT